MGRKVVMEIERYRRDSGRAKRGGCIPGQSAGAVPDGRREASRHVIVPYVGGLAERGPLMAGRPVEQTDRWVRNKNWLSRRDKMSGEGRMQGEGILGHDAKGAHCRTRAVVMMMFVTVERAVILLVLVLRAGPLVVEGNVLSGSRVVIMVAGTLGGRGDLVVINGQMGGAIVAVTGHFVGPRRGVREE